MLECDWNGVIEDLSRGKSFTKEKVFQSTAETLIKVNENAEQTDLRNLGTDLNYKFKPRHKGVPIFFSLLHIFSVYGLYYCFNGATFTTILWCNYI